MMVENRSKGSPRDVFLYLALLITLYVSVYTFIRLMFIYVDRWAHDPLYTGAYYDLGGIRWAISVLMFVFPALLVVSGIIGKDLKRRDYASEFKARKWVLSLTLFVSALATVGDLVYLTYSFLSGDLTSNYVWKSLTVLFVAGFTFSYYLWDLKSPYSRMAQAKALQYFVVGVVLTSIAAGFLIVGTPGQQRAKRVDEDKVYDLVRIENYAKIYYEQKNALPTGLVELSNFAGSSNFMLDPETNVPYEYRPLGPTSFELCANFKTKSVSRERSFRDSEWRYVPGRNCFTRKVEATKK